MPPSPKRSVILASVLLLLIVVIWFIWGIFVPWYGRLTGRAIQPIASESAEWLGEQSEVLKGLLLLTPISGQVLSGNRTISVRVFHNSSEPTMLEIYLQPISAQPSLLFRSPLIEGNNTYSFTLETQKFPDKGCGYRLLVRLKGQRKTRVDSTNYFSILNNPRELKWESFMNPNSTNLSQISGLPTNQRIELSKPGFGRVSFNGKMLLPGTDFDNGLIWDKGRVFISPEEFPCWKNPGNSIIVEFEGLNLNQPKPLINGTPCKDACRILGYEGGRLYLELFRVGELEVVEGLKSRLSVSNPSMDEREYSVGESLTFTANYTTLLGTPIYGNGVVCTLILPSEDKSIEMGYQLDKRVYIAAPVLTMEGKHEYMVRCSHSDVPEYANTQSGFYEINPQKVYI